MSFEKTAAPHPDDTIVVVSSAPGPGARAIVRVSGPNTRAVVGAIFSPSPRAGEGSERSERVRGRFATPTPHPPRTVVLGCPLPHGERAMDSPLRFGEGLGRGRYLIPGSLRLSGVHSPLPATLYFFPGPHSYTG